MNTELVLASALSLIVGAIVAYIFALSKVKNLQAEREKEAEEIIKRAKDKAQDIRREAKKEAKEIINEERSQLEKEFQKRSQSLQDQERGLTRKEVSLDQKIEAKERELDKLKDKERDLEKEKTAAIAERERLKLRHEEISQMLENVAGMTKDEAKEQLIAVMEEEAKVDAAKRIRVVEDEANEEAEK